LHGTASRKLIIEQVWYLKRNFSKHWRSCCAIAATPSHGHASRILKSTSSGTNANVEYGIKCCNEHEFWCSTIAGHGRSEYLAKALLCHGNGYATTWNATAITAAYGGATGDAIEAHYASNTSKFIEYEHKFATYLHAIIANEPIVWLITNECLVLDLGRCQSVNVDVWLLNANAIIARHARTLTAAWYDARIITWHAIRLSKLRVQSKYVK